MAEIASRKRPDVLSRIETGPAAKNHAVEWGRDRGRGHSVSNALCGRMRRICAIYPGESLHSTKVVPFI